MAKASFLFLLLMACFWLPTRAQLTKPVGSTSSQSPPARPAFPLSMADLGEFPYLKTLPNYSPSNSSDSLTVETNQVYCFDGKRLFTVDGKTSTQKLTRRDQNKKGLSEFDCIRNFDQLITTLGGRKVYQGKLPADALKTLAGRDLVELSAKGQLVGSGFYGLVEYVIQTPQKEVWIQLNPFTLGSDFYSLLVVEKTVTLLAANTNKPNPVLARLEQDKRAVIHLAFEPDKASLLSESKDELLSLVGVFQAHPTWRIRLACHLASVGPGPYSLSLSEQRAQALKSELVGLGVKPSLVEVVGFGDQQPLVSNDTEQGRLTNSRFEITLL